MSRIRGLEKPRSVFARIAYFMTRRRLGRVITPIRVMAHHPRLLRGYAHMEMAQQAANSLPLSLKALVDVYVARLIGCPF